MSTCPFPATIPVFNDKPSVVGRRHQVRASPNPRQRPPRCTRVYIATRRGSRPLISPRDSPQLWIKSPNISRDHCELRADPAQPGGCTVKVKGMNPVYVRPRGDTGTRAKVPHGEQHGMAPGEILELIGDAEDKDGLTKHQYRFRLDDPFAAAPTESVAAGPVGTASNFPITVDQTVQWLGSRLPAMLRSAAQEACLAEGIDGSVLVTMSEEEMGWGRRGREEDYIWHYRIIHILHTHNINIHTVTAKAFCITRSHSCMTCPTWIEPGQCCARYLLVLHIV